MPDTDNRGIKQKTNELKSFLESEGFEVWLQDFEEADEPIECLCVKLPDDEFGTDRVVQFIFLPFDGMEMLENFDCLQVLYGLPIDLNNDNIEETAAALDVLNNMILAGHLGIFKDNIFYRYCYFIPKTEISLNGSHYIDHIIFLITTVVGFTPLIESINNGKSSLDDFCEALGEIQELGQQARQG